MKHKFSVGERVLCFEPDKSKARVLYDAKILDANIRDGKLKKEPEYKIHFQGWNSAWDRWADESLVLKSNEENKKLQRKLARKAIQQLKVHGRKRVHLPGVASVLKNTTVQDDSSDSDCSVTSEQIKALFPDGVLESDSAPNSPQIKRRRRSSNVSARKADEGPHCSSEVTVEVESALEASLNIAAPLVRKLPNIEIPAVLLQRLEEDNIFVAKRNMVVDLPAKLNVVQILENYVKYFALNVALLPSSEKHVKMTQTLGDVPPPEKNLNLCKETCEELRVLFDFVLPLVLLYGSEQKQCKKIIPNTVVKSSDEVEVSKSLCLRLTSTPLSAKASAETTTTTPTKTQPTAKGLVAGQHEVPSSTTGTPLSHRKKKSSPQKANKPRKKTAEEQIIEETHTYLIPDQPKLDRTGLANDSQGRRRSSRLSHHLHSPEASSEEALISPPMSPDSNHECSEASVNKDSSGEQAESYYVNVETKTFLRPPPHHKHGMLEQDLGVAASPLPMLCRDQNSCSSEKIGPSEMCQEAYVGSAGSDVRRAVQLAQVWKWKLVPTDYRPPDGAYVPCSFIYGVHHFLRLFVKLPALFSRMNIPDAKLKVIIRHIHQLLRFIADYEREIYILSRNYVSGSTGNTP